MNERRGLGRRSRRSDEEVRPQAADGCTRRGLHKARARPSSASSGVVRELPVVDVDMWLLPCFPPTSHTWLRDVVTRGAVWLPPVHVGVWGIVTWDNF